MSMAQHHVHTMHTCCHPNGDKHHVAMRFMQLHPHTESDLQGVILRFEDVSRPCML